MRRALWLTFMSLFICFNTASAQTTAFTYQGKLADNNTPPLPLSGDYDFQFKLFDLASLGTQLGTALTFDGAGGNPPFVVVKSGIFTVNLDFGVCASCFNGSARFLEIAVRVHGGGSYTMLAPRQPITSTPYALMSKNATSADSLSVTCVSCVTSSQIQSVQGTQVTGNIAGSQINGVIPVGSVPAGSSNYINNSPPTPQAGATFDITSGHFSGGVRIEGAGFITPDTPSLSLASTGSVKVDAPFLPGGRFTILENGNVGISIGAPTEKLHVVGNGVFTGNLNANGVTANGTVNGNIVNATTQFNLAGFRFLTNTSAALTLGTTAGQSLTSGFDNLLFGSFAGAQLSAGSRNSFFGQAAGLEGTLMSNNTFIGHAAGSSNGRNSSVADNNTFIGRSAGANHQAGSSNTALGSNATVLDGIDNATAIGANAQAFLSNSLVLGANNVNVGIGTSAPGDKLEVNGILRLDSLGAAGGTSLCRNASNQISSCSSSIRYKSNISTLHSGLRVIDKLRPVTFDWKQGGEHDLGLVAEEVASVVPLLVTHNDNGEVEGVKYDRIGVLLINVVKEQQTQIAAQQSQNASQQHLIEKQQQQINEQQRQLEALKRLVCSSHRKDKACK